MAHLALLNEPRQRAHGVLDRHGGIDAVDIIEVDAIDPEPLQAGLAALRDVFRPAVGAGRAVRQADVAELGGEHHLVAPSLDRAADQHLVRTVAAISVGGIDEIDPEFDRAMDRGDGLGLAGLAVDRRHAHAAKADGSHLKVSQTATLHVRSPRNGIGPLSLSTSPARPSLSPRGRASAREKPFWPTQSGTILASHSAGGASHGCDRGADGPGVSGSADRAGTEPGAAADPPDGGGARTRPRPDAALALRADRGRGARAARRSDGAVIEAPRARCARG